MAIIGIVALGVGFLIGALSTTPILQESVSSFYEKNNTMDVCLKSPYGFNNDDVERVKEKSSVKEAYGSYSSDMIVTFNEEKVVSRLMSLDDVNKVKLLEGELPKSNDECVVKKSNGELKDFVIGDKIGVGEKTIVITGIVNSPLYYSSEKETANLNYGSIEAFFFVQKDILDQGRYSDIFVVLDIDKDNCFTDEYKEKVTLFKEELLSIDSNWLGYTRAETVSYAMYDISSKKVEDVAKIFPYFFFIVALLVTLATMARMIEEERQQIGTLKALGYGRFMIVRKYIYYSGIATIIGCVIGVIWGFIVLPTVLYNTYRGLFILPNIRLRIIPLYSIVSCAVIIASTLVATIFAAAKSLRERAAQLMQPKSPKPGKRILLERIPLLWNRLSFSYKATARNLFRYKKHFFMTVLGVAGCTALVVTGFGLRDSVRSISNKQYSDVLKYESKLVVSNFDENIKQSLDDYYVMDTYSSEACYKKEKINLTIYMVDQRVNDYISIHYRKNKKEIALDKNSVVLCETASVMLNIKKGQSIEVKTDKGYVSLVVNDICENYTSNYLYLGEDVYNQYFTSNVKTVLTNNKVDFSSLSENVLSASWKSQEKKTYSGIISNMEVFTVVLILAAGSLGMIVIYNLININIRERQKELATLRVLGYYDNEVLIYMYREIFILSIIGSFIGLVLGIFLHKYVIYTSESMDVIFGRDISLLSHLYSFILTLAFTCLVSLIMIRKIKSIEMTESMKAVE